MAKRFTIRAFVKTIDDGLMGVINSISGDGEVVGVKLNNGGYAEFLRGELELV